MPKKRFIRKVAEKYCNRVKECRLKLSNLTQKELAEKTGISQNIVNAIENNRLFLSSPHALLIAEVLGCKLDELYVLKGKRVEEKEVFANSNKYPSTVDVITHYNQLLAADYDNFIGVENAEDTVVTIAALKLFYKFQTLENIIRYFAMIQAQLEQSRFLQRGTFSLIALSSEKVIEGIQTQRYLNNRKCVKEKNQKKVFCININKINKKEKTYTHAINNMCDFLKADSEKTAEEQECTAVITHYNQLLAADLVNFRNAEVTDENAEGRLTVAAAAKLLKEFRTIENITRYFATIKEQLTRSRFLRDSKWSLVSLASDKIIFGVQTERYIDVSEHPAEHPDERRQRLELEALAEHLEQLRCAEKTREHVNYSDNCDDTKHNDYEGFEKARLYVNSGHSDENVKHNHRGSIISLAEGLEYFKSNLGLK